MKKQSLKLLFAATIILALVFSMNISVFAGSRYEGSSGRSSYGAPRTVNGITKYFGADSATKATASVQATSSGFTPFITSTITLQSAALGSSSYSNVAGSSSTKTVYDMIIINHAVKYTISSSKDYRIKIELTDEVNGVESTTTTYCYLSR